MVQQDLDEILEAATSIKLVGRAVNEMEMDGVERGTCALIISQAVAVICSAVERLEAEIRD